MTIVSEELKLYKDSGGRLSSTEVLNGYLNGLFPNVSEDERTAGITITKKAFFKVASAANTQAVNAKTYLADITPSGGRAVIVAATQRDTTPAGRYYGAGRLNADVIATATSIIVDAEAGNGVNLIFQVGDKLRIDDGSNGEFVTIDTVSWATDQATITLTAGLKYPYLAASATTISSCIESATIECSTDNWGETSTSGNYDEIAYPVTNNNIGGIEQTWTLTFTSTTDFSVIGDTVGNVGTGSISANFTPINADFAQAYFTLLASGFGGSWAVNDTIVFQTHPATQAFFLQLIVDAGTAEYSNDDITPQIYIESA